MMSLNALWKRRAGNGDPVPMVRMFSLTNLSVKYSSEDHAMVCLRRKEEERSCGIELGTEAFFSENTSKKTFPAPLFFCSDLTYNI